jgi:hypothetical protein
MGSPQQSLYSTPAFELFRRGLVVQSIQRFRGINSYTTLAQLGPEWAQDLLNVVISGSGGISKLRLPVNLSPAVANFIVGAGNFNFGPQFFWDFQQANGTRQVLAAFNYGGLWGFYAFSNDLAIAAQQGALDQGATQWSAVTANNILFLASGVNMWKYTGTQIQAWGLLVPTAAPSNPTAAAGNLSPATGYSYGFSNMNSATGEVSNISPVSGSTGAQTNKKFTTTEPNAWYNSQGTDSIVWFRNLDGGGDWFRLAQVNQATGAVITFGAGASVVASTSLSVGDTITDNSPDSALDQTTRGPLLNNPPPVGKFLAQGQGRVIVMNLKGAPNQAAYSGFEQIFLGRPESCFPPNNLLNLQIGADDIAGGGILQSGVVMFSRTGRMFMLRGQMEDISLLVPVNFTQYLEELPWTLGCASHFTIHATPYGLVWLAGDKTVQLFDGRSEPVDISAGIYPYLRRITPGTEQNCVASYFNWLERDWYVLLAAVDGSLSNNRAFFFAFNKQPGTDTIESVEAFVSDLPAQIAGSVPFIGLITTSKFQRMLCIGAGGRIQQLPVTSDTVGGVTLDMTINPPTNGVLSAYWRGGYFGTDSPYRSKSWRWARLLSDQDPKTFSLVMRYVDDEQRTFLNPEIKGPFKLSASKLGLNGWRAKKASVEIDFPATDAPCNVLELQVAAIPTSDR